MNNSVISIVIPVYKVEKYLDRCVESLVKQSYKNLEIILVDDGSPDNCPKMCDDWAKKDGRIKVVHKQNGGVSSARNEGIKIATGDFITFVDSDDYLTEDFSLALKTFNKELDIVCVPYFEERETDKIMHIPHISMLKKSIIDIHKYKVEAQFYNSICFKIFNTNYIKSNNIQLDTQIHFGEDLKFSLNSLYNTEKFEFLGIPYYVYCRNGESATANVTYAKICNTLDVCKYGISFINSIKNKSKLKFFKKLISCNLFFVFSQIGKYSETENKELVVEVSKLKKNIIFSGSLKHRLIVLTLKLFGVKITSKLFNFIKILIRK